MFIFMNFINKSFKRYIDQPLIRILMVYIGNLMIIDPDMEAIQYYQEKINIWAKNIEPQAHEASLQKQYNTFASNLHSHFDLYITFDNRIIQAIVNLATNFKEYFEYSSEPQLKSTLKGNLRKIVQVLACNRFISNKQLLQLKKHFQQSYLCFKLNIFCEKMHQFNEKSGEMQVGKFIKKVWKETVNDRFKQTWLYLQEKQINNDLLRRLTQLCKPLLVEYQLDRLQYFAKYFQKQTKINQTPSQKAIIVKKREVLAQKIQIIEPFVLRSTSADDKLLYSKQIDLFATQISLFLNQKLKQKAFQEIDQVKRSIIKYSEISENGYRKILNSLIYNLYGSMKSRLALFRQCDADITIDSDMMNLGDRQNKIKILQFIREILKRDLLNFFMYCNVESVLNGSIKIPFVRITPTFIASKTKVLKNIDISIKNEQGVNNSEMLAQYSAQPQILKFCNLIKKWANQRHLVAKAFPYNKFSSYGVVLMTLFYLISTKQVPKVVKKQDKFVLEEPLNFKPVPILQNFKNFLRFYDSRGRFFSERLVVCLCQEIPKDFPRIYLVDMYDCVDGSNAGRMAFQHRCMFFREIIQTFTMLQQRESIHGIIFRKKY